MQTSNSRLFPTCRTKPKLYPHDCLYYQCAHVCESFKIIIKTRMKIKVKESCWSSRNQLVCTLSSRSPLLIRRHKHMKTSSTFRVLLVVDPMIKHDFIICDTRINQKTDSPLSQCFPPASDPCFALRKTCSRASKTRSSERV